MRGPGREYAVTTSFPNPWHEQARSILQNHGTRFNPNTAWGRKKAMDYAEEHKTYAAAALSLMGKTQQETQAKTRAVMEQKVGLFFFGEVVGAGRTSLFSNDNPWHTVDGSVPSATRRGQKQHHLPPKHDKPKNAATILPLHPYDGTSALLLLSFFYIE